MSLRIGIVSQAYHPAVGGVTEHVDATARHLRARGHEVTVVTARYAGNGHPEPGIVRLGWNVVVPYNGAQNNLTVGLELKAALAGAIENGRFDLIHVHCPLSPTLPLLALSLARQPIVGTFHSTADSDLPFRIFRRSLLPLYGRIDRPIAVSESARSFVERHFPGPIDIVPNGVDRSRFRPRIEPLPEFASGGPNVLFVGRFDPRKGLPDLLEAARGLAEQGLAFRLILVGDGWLRGRAERMARGALAERVRFVGQVGHDLLPRYYASSDVFCSPARGGESFGLVLLEAMACGVPIVATDLPGYRRVLTHEREGLIVPPRRVDALAGALRRLLRDEPLRARLGAAGVETSSAYDWEGITDQLESIYAAAMRGPDRRRTSTDGAAPALIR